MAITPGLIPASDGSRQTHLSTMSECFEFICRRSSCSPRNPSGWSLHWRHLTLGCFGRWYCVLLEAVAMLLFPSLLAEWVCVGDRFTAGASVSGDAEGFGAILVRRPF